MYHACWPPPTAKLSNASGFVKEGDINPGEYGLNYPILRLGSASQRARLLAYVAVHCSTVKSGESLLERCGVATIAA
jgi:hypothetical protein